MANISPGVYTKIVDLSTYVQTVPGSIGLICALTEKGEDNKLKMIASQESLISEFGEPNISTYGKSYGQGLYQAYNFLSESYLYFMRCLPDDATYSNIRINGKLGSTDSTAELSLDYVSSLNTKTEIETALSTSGDTKRLCILYPIGRGVYYNSLGVRFTEYFNPLYFNTYVMDIYEKQSDGSEVIVESFTVSFNPEDTDDSGSSIFIEDVLETYSLLLRAKVGDDGYELLSKIFDKEIGNVSVTITSGSASISDDKQDFSDWQNSTETGNSTYMVIAKDAKGNEIYGWLGKATGTFEDSINVFNGRDLDTASQSWSGDTTLFDDTSEIIYQIRESNASIADLFLSSDPVPMKKGSDGAILDSVGSIVSSEATKVLASAYAGTIDDSILDTDNIYFNLVFDAGYPADVKTQISSLAETRADCLAILDNGDNSSFSNSISTRTNTNTFNTKYTTIFEEFNKIYDTFTGKDIWVSPLYHMSYILPRNDRVAELWYAAAGFNRASISSIKELRFNPRQGQRDQMYLKQLNPIVKFNQGYVVWSQLTSQAKASALQDINIMRLILYCERALSQYCKSFIFEMNDAVTWGQVKSNITDFLQNVKRKRGLTDYKVEVGATEYELKSKTFHVNVTLVPTRVVEKIDLVFFIK